MTDDDRRTWQARYSGGHAPVQPTPNRWLAAQSAPLAAVEAAHTDPPAALDVACGAGGSLLWLARRGWHVTGVDISAAALALAHAELDAAGLLDRATLLEADLDEWRPPANCCDLLTCFYFLDRRLMPSFCAAVRPGGLICLQTYHTGRLRTRPHTNPAHLLEPGELTALVRSWGWPLLAAQTDAQTEAILAQKL